MLKHFTCEKDTHYFVLSVKKNKYWKLSEDFISFTNEKGSREKSSVGALFSWTGKLWNDGFDLSKFLKIVWASKKENTFYLLFSDRKWRRNGFADPQFLATQFEQIHRLDSISRFFFLSFKELETFNSSIKEPPKERPFHWNKNSFSAVIILDKGVALVFTCDVVFC